MTRDKAPAPGTRDVVKLRHPLDGTPTIKPSPEALQAMADRIDAQVADEVYRALQSGAHAPEPASGATAQPPLSFHPMSIAMTYPPQTAGECGHATVRRYWTASGEWCEDCYNRAVRILGR